jgi:hypothetical protein
MLKVDNPPKMEMLGVGALIFLSGRLRLQTMFTAPTVDDKRVTMMNYDNNNNNNSDRDSTAQSTAVSTFIRAPTPQGHHDTAAIVSHTQIS